MIKKSLLTMVGLFVLSSLASANIGDTYQQSVARYGQPWKNLGNGWVAWATDRDNTVNENFGPDGRCRAIAYRRFTGVNYGPTELMTRISQNLPSGGSFSEIPVDLGRAWLSTNGATAVLMVEDHQGQGRNPVLLSIWSREMHQAVDAAEKAEAAKAAVPAPTPALAEFEKVSVGDLVRNSNVS